MTPPDPRDRVVDAAIAFVVSADADDDRRGRPEPRPYGVWPELLELVAALDAVRPGWWASTPRVANDG